MSVGDNFNTFCNNIAISTTDRSSISSRYKRITKRLNIDFWDSDSDTSHSLYVGSYGRGTAINGFSDLDMIFILPFSCYEQYNNYSGNGQSALLQAVRNSLQKTYPTTFIGGDGQVVKIEFDDGITFEIVPAFKNNDNSYTYPDSNEGGSWKITNPQPEIIAMSDMDQQCNNNLKRLCRMFRAWKNEWSVDIGGLLIDTLAYKFLKDWEYKNNSYMFYDWMSRDFFKFLSEQDTNQNKWYAIGSGQVIDRKGYFEFKAKKCYNISLEAIKDESNGYEYSSKSKWREIYGNKFPS